MAYQIVSLLLDVAAGLLGAACLLRLYMQYQRVPFGNPVGRFVFALTDWLVLPLRKVLPAVGKVDTASAVAVYLVELAQFAILWLLAGRGSGLEMEPLLRPWRKLVPLVGGLDLSPLVFLVVLQVIAIVIAYLQAAALR